MFPHFHQPVHDDSDASDIWFRTISEIVYDLWCYVVDSATSFVKFFLLEFLTYPKVNNLYFAKIVLVTYHNIYCFDVTMNNLPFFMKIQNSFKYRYNYLTYFLFCELLTCPLPPKKKVLKSAISQVFLYNTRLLEDENHLLEFNDVGMVQIYYHSYLCLKRGFFSPYFYSINFSILQAFYLKDTRLFCHSQNRSYAKLFWKLY